LCDDLLNAINSASVLDISTLATRLHHESSADSVKRVGNNTSTNGDDLGEGEESHWVGVLHVREKDSLTSVEATKVRSTICDNTND